MTAPVFVIRPEPGLSATIKRGRAMGLDLVAMPLSEAEQVEWQMAPATFDGILLGSANGLRHAGAKRAQLAGLPVYAVGEATAAAARDMGFDIALTGAGALQAVVDSLPGDRPLSLLRLAGEERVPINAPAHITIETVTTYRMAHYVLTAPQIAQLGSGGIVLLHSAASAAHFDKEVLRTGIDRNVLALAALSPRIAGSVSDGWKSVGVAPTPDDPALLSLALDMWH